MPQRYDVVFHTDDGHVRSGPFPSMEQAQYFIMSVDPVAWQYNVVEVIKHGQPVSDLLVFRSA